MALNNVPVPGQTLFNSRDLINQNFSVINTAFSVNHVPYNDGTGNQGFHQFINMPAAVPTATTNNGTPQIGLYSNTGSASGVPELFFQRNNLGANAGYSITEAGNATNGWTRLPSGIILKWGQANMPSGGSHADTNPAQTVTYPTGGGIPAFSNVFQIIFGQRFPTNATSLGSNGFGIYTSTTTNFSVTWSGSNASNTILTYLAIGN